MRDESESATKLASDDARAHLNLATQRVCVIFSGALEES